MEKFVPVVVIKEIGETDKILKALKNNGINCAEITFRTACAKEAIAYAINNGQPGDIIVLAGKGHEDYQEIKGVKYPMDERDLIAQILADK
jgi:UDP-N-acetylmuramyl tripeptide synthase